MQIDYAKGHMGVGSVLAVKFYHALISIVDI